MATRKSPFEPGYFYHCYSRGIDKCPTFIDGSDYWYFLESVHISNRKEKVPQSKRRSLAHGEIWKLGSDRPLVALIAYCLMPNHFHFLIKEIEENGISIFMQRLMTSYTMHFNRKYDRSGGLFTRAFRSKHIGDDRYLRQVFSYIHLNPLDLIIEGMNDKHTIATNENAATNYEFSSLLDYAGRERPQRVLIAKALPW